MSRNRLILVGALTLLLVALAAWQTWRGRQIAACVAAGGAWDGPRSRCEVPRPGPLLERDNLRRG